MILALDDVYDKPNLKEWVHTVHIGYSLFKSRKHQNNWRNSLNSICAKSTLLKKSKNLLIDIEKVINFIFLE